MRFGGAPMSPPCVTGMLTPSTVIWAVRIEFVFAVKEKVTTPLLLPTIVNHGWSLVGANWAWRFIIAGRTMGNESLPKIINLHAQFAPTSDQPWLTIVGSNNGVVTFSFTANTNSMRTAHITVLGVSIPVTQGGLIGAPPNLISAMILNNGAFRFQFTNTDGATFTVLTATDPMLPLSNWTALGSPSNMAPGLFQFTAPPSPNDQQRYYRVRSP